MWTQNYHPLFDSLGASAVAAALPLVVLGYALGVQRMPSWKASMLALGAGLVLALGAYGMPTKLALASALYGAAFGLFPLGFLVFSAILLFDIVVASGQFDAIRRSLGSINPDHRIQALLIAFAFGAFLEGAAGAGTPVAISASLLAGLGFPPFVAGGISLLANTAPVAFGALGLPIITLAAVTGLPVLKLSAAVGRICPIAALIIPTYLVMVLAGGRRALQVWPALLTCGVAFAGVQFLVANLIGPYLVDILSAIAAIVAIVALLRVWGPGDCFLVTEHESASGALAGSPGRTHPVIAESETENARAHQLGFLRVWQPYLLLVATVLVWGFGPVQRLLDSATVHLEVPLLHNSVARVPPVVPVLSPYPAVFLFNWLGAAGTACLVAALMAASTSGIGFRRFCQLGANTARRLALPELTFALMLALAFLMNYAGATATLGLALARTGALFPFFGSYLGLLGVFLTGSDTSSNALFGQLQVVSAKQLHLNPLLMTAVNTCGGVMGKMISVQSIAVAAAATGMAGEDEGRLFRFTLKHSLLLGALVGILALAYAYLVPGWMVTP